MELMVNKILIINISGRSLFVLSFSFIVKTNLNEMIIPISSEKEGDIYFLGIFFLNKSLEKAKKSCLKDEGSFFQRSHCMSIEKGVVSFETCFRKRKGRSSFRLTRRHPARNE